MAWRVRFAPIVGTGGMVAVRTASASDICLLPAGFRALTIAADLGYRGSRRGLSNPKQAIEGSLYFHRLEEIMSGTPSPKDATRLLASLRRGEELKRIRVAERKLAPQLVLLRKWQSKRLARTHADLLASKRYGPAARFFLTDIYAPRDFSQRDQDIMSLYNFMLRFLPPRLLHPLALTVELYNLTEQLDRALLHALVDDLGMTDTLTTELYAEAYRRCDNYDERRRQIDLIAEVGEAVDRLVRLPLVSTTIRFARGPARRAGWNELHDFLERGFKAFKQMRGADLFVRTVRERETRILDRIFEGDPDPFGFELEVTLEE